MPRTAVVVAVLLAAGCAHTGSRGERAPSAAAVKLATDEDYARVRADYDVLAVGDPDRARLREALGRWLGDQARRELGAGRLEEAWEQFARALSLWDPDELKSPPPDDTFAAAAADLERAFRRRGAHREVLTLLAVQIALRPGAGDAFTRWNQLTAWLREGGPAAAPETCFDKNCEQLIDDLESAVASFPSPFLVEKLAALYWQRHASAGGAGRELLGKGGIFPLLAGRAAAHTGTELARLYLRVSRPDAALQSLQRLAGLPGDNPPLRDAVAAYVAADARPLDALALARVFTRDKDGVVIAQRICMDTTRRFPHAAEPELCVGELAIQLEQITIAIRAFEKALAIAPDRREAWEALARLHQSRMAQLVGDERTDELEKTLEKVEAFHAAARKRFPNQPLPTSLAGALFEAGRGLYNAGRIDDAVRLFERSISVEPSPPAYEQQAIIELKRERGPAAVALFKQGIDSVQKRRAHMDASQLSYWMGKLQRGLGDAYEELGAAHEAETARRDALRAWDDQLKARPDPDDVADAEIERGKILLLLGERERALAAFDKAIDTAPERGATYADLLAFLVPRGERKEALDAFHRALGRGAITEYLKVYCSLWIIDLDRRAGQPEDALAAQILASVNGAKWYHELARWASGRQTEADLAAHADTPARRCEADFYVGLRRLEEGRADEARKLFKRAVSSQMMAFFEFDMAAYYLRHPPGKKLGAPLADGAR